MLTRSNALKPEKGPLFLVFLNTVEDDGKTRKLDSFADARGLVSILGGHAGHGPSAPYPTPSSAQMGALRGLRTAGYSVLSAIAAGRQPGREESLHLEMAIKSALNDAQFRFDASGLSIRPGPLGGLHDALVLSLNDLLASDDLDRLRECKRCTHLFLDHGRGQGRRWCSMARCGNRAKAETFRKRHRAEQGKIA